MNKRYRRAYLAGVLFLACMLVVSTILLINFAKKPAFAQHTVGLSLLKSKRPDQYAINIMPLGDSITFGVGSSDLGGYREPLWNKMEATGWDTRFVGSQQSGPASLLERHNEGHSGWRIDQISAHITSWLQAARPQIILLHIGTNDILQGASPVVAEARLSYLLSQITTDDPQAEIIVAQIIPLIRLGRNANVIAYNNAIPGIVRAFDAQGKHIFSVDMYDAIPISDLIDGVHPSSLGYASMATVWYTALKPLVEQYKAA